MQCQTPPTMESKLHIVILNLLHFNMIWGTEQQRSNLFAGNGGSQLPYCWEFIILWIQDFSLIHYSYRADFALGWLRWFIIIAALAVITTLCKHAVSALCKAKNDRPVMVKTVCPLIILTPCKSNSVILPIIYIWSVPFFSASSFSYATAICGLFLIMWKRDGSSLYTPQFLMHFQCKLPHSLLLFKGLTIVKCWNYNVMSETWVSVE